MGKRLLKACSKECNDNKEFRETVKLFLPDKNETLTEIDYWQNEVKYFQSIMVKQELRVASY